MKESQKLTICQWAKEDRPREKMMVKGADALSDAELLAILIGSGNTEESAGKEAQENTEQGKEVQENTEQENIAQENPAPESASQEETTPAENGSVKTEDPAA